MEEPARSEENGITLIAWREVGVSMRYCLAHECGIDCECEFFLRDAFAEEQ